MMKKMFFAVGLAAFCCSLPEKIHGTDGRMIILKKMNRILVLFLLLCVYSQASGQEPDYIREILEDELQIRQKPGTENLLADYLEPLHMEEDTVYAILFSPSACLRCEAAISDFYRLLKRNSPDNKMLLISAYGDSAVAARYNREKGYKSDYYLYDTDRSYADIFSFNTGEMMGLYVLKLCPKSGVMIAGGEPTYVSEEFVRQFRAYTERVSPHLYVEEKDEFVFPEVTAKEGHWKAEDMAVPIAQNDFVSSVYDIPKFEGGYFFYTDMLKNGVMLFRQHGKNLEFRAFLQADSTEENRFVRVPEDVLRNQKKAGSVFYIALSANLTDDGRIAISYSLPRLEVEKVEGDEMFLAYYNAPAILTRRLDTLRPDSMVALDFDLAHSNYFHMHFVYDWFADKIWLGCVKLTWPMEFAKEEYAGKVDLDSFDDRFYDTFNPIMASFDVATGKVSGHYGRLEESQRRSKTGYYFQNNLFAHHGRDLLYCNGYTGVLYVADSTRVDSPAASYRAFEIDTSSLPAPDPSEFYTMEYGTLYASSFGRCVTAVKMNGERICCLVRYGRPLQTLSADDRYTFVTIDRKTGERSEYALPVYEGVETLGMGIRKDDGEMNPFVFLKKDGKPYVRTLYLGDGHF